MDNKATTKRMIGAVVLVLVAALLLAWLLKGKNQNQDVTGAEQLTENKPIIGFPGVEDPNAANNNGVLLDPNTAQNTNGAEQNLEGSTNQAAGLEVRPVVENGQVTTQVNGSLGAGEVKPFASSSSSTSTEQATDSKKAATAETGSVGSVGVSSGSTASSSSVSVNASAKDRPKTETAEPKRSSAVIVNERPVPRADSEESMRERVAREAATRKAAEAKAAAEKAAAEKSKELAAAKAADAKAAAKSEESAAGKTAATGTATAGGFAIQFMASADKAKAEAVAKPLAAEGYKLAVAEATVDGKAIYRVRLSGFASKEEAVAAQAKMKARYTQNPDVQNSIVTTQ